MHDAEFYRGILTELKKEAEAPAAVPKKKWYQNPWARGALTVGGAALGGYLGNKAHKAYQAQSAPSPERMPTGIDLNPAPTPSALHTIDNASSSASLAALGGAGATGLGRIGLNAAGRISSLKPATSTLYNATKPIAPALGRTALGLAGVGMAADTLGSDMNLGTKALALGGAGTDIAAQMTGREGVTKALTRLAPRAVAGTAGRAAGMLFGAPMYAAYGAGIAGNMEIDSRVNSAANFAGRQSYNSDLAMNALTQLRSKNPEQLAQGKQALKFLFETPEGQDFINQTTNPGTKGIAGYALGGQDFEESPVTSHLFDLLRKAKIDLARKERSVTVP